MLALLELDRTTAQKRCSFFCRPSTHPVERLSWHYPSSSKMGYTICLPNHKCLDHLTSPSTIPEQCFFFFGNNSNYFPGKIILGTCLAYCSTIYQLGKKLSCDQTLPCKSPTHALWAPLIRV